MTLPFSKTRRAGDLLFLSGELPFLPDGRIPPGIAEQTTLTLQRIKTTLEAADLTLADVVQATVHLVHAHDFAEFNRAYLDNMPEPFPVRTTVVAELVVPGALIEISAVAAFPDQ